jgi:hypothetical protein
VDVVAREAAVVAALHLVVVGDLEVRTFITHPDRLSWPLFFLSRYLDV